MEAQADGPEFLPDTESLVERARSERLDILALDRARAAGEERIAQATLERFPRLEIGPFVTQEAGNDGFFIGATAVLELPVLESGSAGVEAARAGRDLLEAEYEARLASVRAEVLRGVERYRVATRLRNLYAQDILPRVQEAVERARDAVESGLRDETFLLSARSRLIAVEREQASNQLELDAAWISLEAACGRVLTRGVAGAAEGAGDPAEGSS